MRSWSRNRVLVWIAAAVFLAVAILVFGSLGPTDDEKKVPGSKERAATIASQAQDALSREETATAHRLALRALELDATNTTARSVADESDAQERTDTDAEVPAEPAGVRDDTAYLKPSPNLTALLPGTIASWVREPPTMVGPDAVITYDPSGGSEAARTVTHALLSVHDRGSTAAAEKFPVEVHGKLYALDVSSSRVGVIDSVRFGTDGSGVAAVVFTRGRFVFEVQVAVQPSVDPAAVRGIALQLAGALPATVR